MSRLVTTTAAAGTATVAVLGLAAELSWHAGWLSYELLELLSLSAEGNLPTWWASILLFSCGLTLASIARAAELSRPHWWGLAVIFFYMSLDEAAQLHEELGAIFGEGEGVLYFTWVIPAVVIVAAVLAVYARFLWRLEARSRARFLIAGGIYVGGALVMELPLGWWADTHGQGTLGYALIDFVEETMEMVGASSFLVALVRHREGS